MKNTAIILLTIIISSCGNNDSVKLEPEDLVDKNFRWDFNKRRTLIYDYIAEEKTEVYSDFTKKENILHTHVNAKLFIEPNRNGKANVSMKDNMFTFYNDDGSIDDTMHTELSNKFDGMRPEGSRSMLQVKTLYDLIFPLPGEMISIGDVYEYPVKRAISVYGIKGFSKGNYQLNFERFEVFLGRKCAVLLGEINLSEVEIGEEIQGELESTLIGEGTFYFDIENGNYVGVDIEIEDYFLYNSENEDDFLASQERSGKNFIKVRLDTILSH